MPKSYPKDIRNRARKLAMKGTLRSEIALILGVSHANVYLWTKDIKLPRQRASPKQDIIMNDLAVKGYYILHGGDLTTVRSMREKRQIRMAHIKGVNIAFVDGRELDALKAYLRYRKIHYISFQRLSSIEKAFRLRNTQEVKEFLDDNNVKLTDYM